VLCSMWSYRIFAANVDRPRAFSAMPSVLWHCWLGSTKGNRPVKKLSGEVLAWLSVWSKVQTCIRPSWCHYHSLSLASVKSRLVLPFWYRLTLVVLEKRPLNGCVCVCVCFSKIEWLIRVAHMVLPFWYRLTCMYVCWQTKMAVIFVLG